MLAGGVQTEAITIPACVLLNNCVEGQISCQTPGQMFGVAEMQMKLFAINKMVNFITQ
jgi:hypothetical protein